MSVSDSFVHSFPCHSGLNYTDITRISLELYMLTKLDTHITKLVE